MRKTKKDILLNKATVAALAAGHRIMTIYKKDNLFVDYKEDKSPLTIADKDSNRIICDLLGEEFPILSEESKEVPYENRKDWEYFWMVDPLDGTKEFIKRNGEFTVNIALIHKDKPILGVVYAPDLDELYFAHDDLGSFCKYKASEPINYSIVKCDVTDKSENTRVFFSRSHCNEVTQNYLDQFSEIEKMQMGSSLKFCKIASGEADLYPRFHPCMEWDTAASQIILEMAGGIIRNVENDRPLIYNKENLVNPSFVASKISS